MDDLVVQNEIIIGTVAETAGFRGVATMAMIQGAVFISGSPREVICHIKTTMMYTMAQDNQDFPVLDAGFPAWVEVDDDLEHISTVMQVLYT